MSGSKYIIFVICIHDIILLASNNIIFLSEINDATLSFWYEES